MYRHTIIIAALFCSGCALFGQKYVASEEERAERIKMTMATTALEASADLIDMAVVLPMPEQYSAWPQAGGRSDNNTGHIHAGQNLRILWSAKAVAGSTRRQPLVSPPIIAKERIFILDGEQNIHAFALESGENIWSQPLAGLLADDKIAIGGGLGFGDGKLIASSGFGYVTAIDPEDGSRLWTLETGVPMSGAASIHDGRAYVTSSNNDLFAINIENGETIWVDHTIAEPARMLLSPSPAVTDNLLVAPFSSGELIAYLPANGRRLWVDTLALPGRFSPLSAINDIASRPVLDGQTIYAASQSGILSAIDSRSGSRIWALEFSAINPPAPIGEFLFAINSDAQLICVNKHDGKILWMRQLAQFHNPEKKKGRIVWTGPIIAMDRVILTASTGDMVALSVQDGSEIARLQLGHKIMLEPISTGKQLYLLADDGFLLAIE